ncbi:MAG: hypothetical protein H0T73_20710 [Ardenticatenales bacterium]|nr:hypothetical protein [Ardenticatenales bacterium]
MLQVTPQPRFRALVETVLDGWQATTPLPAAGGLALALEAASATAQQYQALAQVDMIWTGPEVGEVHTRRTDQALLQVIQAAERELLVVSFAVYKIPLVTQGFIEAVRRGVRLRICLESPEASG